MKISSKLSLFALAFLLFLFIGCEPQHDMGKIEAQVNEMNDLVVKAILESTPDSVLKLYTEDAISLPSYQPMMKGMEAFKEHSKNQPPMDMKKFVLTSTDILVSGNFVVDIGTYDLIINMPDGEIPDKGKYLTLYEIQRDGSLLMKVDTWNTDFNPWEQMMAHQEAEKAEKK